MTVRSLVPLIKCNDMLLLCDRIELGLIRCDCVEDMLSEKYLDMEVDYIESDEDIPNTVVIHVLKDESA